MKRKLLFVLFVIIVLFLISCNSVNNEENSENISDQILSARGISLDNKNMKPSKTELEQVGPIGMSKRSYDEIKAQYPDKTILTVWGICPSDYITDSLNEYLVKNGTDYVVYFTERTEKNILIDQPKTNPEQEEIKKQLLYELLEKTDIIAIDREYFHEMAKKNCLAPWNNYLTTENGRKLYHSLPENNWKTVTIDHQIFGINGRSDYIYGPPSYIVNKDLMKKYNLTQNDLDKPIDELDNIITKVAKGERKNINFKAVRVDTDNYHNLQEISPSYLSGSLAVTLYNDPRKEAGSILNNTDYLKWLKSLNQYVNKGYVGSKDPRLSNFFIEVNMTSSLPHTNPNYGYYYAKNGELAHSSDVTEIVLHRFYNGSISWNNNGPLGNCIPLKSKHKKDAFDFLNKVYSDSYITNLLLYGIENRNYKMKDKKVDWPFTRMNEEYIGNSYLTYPRFFEYPDKKERYFALQKSLPYVYSDFYFDPTNVQNEIRETNQVMYRLSDIFSGNIKDFDTYIDGLKKQLNEKGVQKLIDEVNRQKEAWLSEQKDNQRDGRHEN